VVCVQSYIGRQRIYIDSSWRTRQDARDRVKLLKGCITTADHSNYYKVVKRGDVRKEYPLEMEGFVTEFSECMFDPRVSGSPGFSLKIMMDWMNSPDASYIKSLMMNGCISKCKILIEFNEAVEDKG